MENVSATVVVLLALVAGIAAGSYTGALETLAAVLGSLWVNALRMTVLPLVTALLITSTAGLRPGEPGKTIGRTLLLFLGMTAAAGMLAALVAPAALAQLSLTSVEREALRSAWKAPGKPPSFAAWLTGVIPVNPVAAAAEGNMLGVIVFAVTLGLALGTVPREKSGAVVAFFESIAAATQVILRWVLAAAPLGVLALGYTLARAGRGAVGALGFYLMLLIAIFLLVLAGLYLLIAVARPVPWLAFARAVLPAQVTAFGSRSSLAAMPLLVRAAEHDLGLNAAKVGLALPLAMALLRISAPCSQIVAVLFTARVFGVALGPLEVAWAAVMAILLSFSVPGVPNGSFLIMMPLFETMGVPVEAIGLLLAIDMAPDLFKTVTNVTAHLAAVCLLSTDHQR